MNTERAMIAVKGLVGWHEYGCSDPVALSGGGTSQSTFTRGPIYDTKELRAPRLYDISAAWLLAQGAWVAAVAWGVLAILLTR